MARHADRHLACRAVELPYVGLGVFLMLPYLSLPRGPCTCCDAAGNAASIHESWTTTGLCGLLQLGDPDV